MKKEKKISSVFKKILPYLLMLVLSAIAAELLFYKGFPSGDDVKFHYANIYDLYLSLKEGKSLEISSMLIGGLGYGRGLFYSPLSHLSVAFVAILFENFGLTLMAAFKLVIFLSIFVSGIFMYHFSLKISKNKIWVSALIACLYILGPYRLFNYFCRNAFAEAYAILWTPLFFMGLYDYVYEKTNAKALVEITLGGVLLYFSHNITALFAYTFGIVFLLFYIKDIFKRFKEDIRFRIYSISTIVIMLSMMSIVLIPSLSNVRTGVYNVSYSDRMWTTLDHVAGDCERTLIYTGFLNLSWLNSNGININLLFLYLVYFFLLTIVYLLLDKKLSEVSVLNNYHILISTSFYLIIGIIIGVNVVTKEFVLGIISVSVLSVGLTYFAKFYDNHNEIYVKDNRFIWAMGTCAFVATLFVSVGGLWYLLPSFYGTIQFPWRLNGLIYLFINLLLVVPLSLYGRKILKTSAILVGIIPFLSQALVEKRLVNSKLKEDVDYDTINSSWRFEIDQDYSTYSGSIGANCEYLPYIYYYNPEKNYEPKYLNTNYYDVRALLSLCIYGGTTLTPKVLSGDAKVSKYIRDVNTSTLSFDLNVEETARIRLPLLYNESTVITLYNKDTNTESNLNFSGDSLYNNGYLSKLTLITCLKGNYSVVVKYNGTMGLNPTFLEGEGEIENAISIAPKFSFDLNSTTDSLIQLPLIYYKGYEIRLVSENGTVTYAKEANPSDTDYLVSFYAPKGKYKVYVNYSGTSRIKLARNFFGLSFFGLYILVLFDKYYNDKKKLEESI